MLEEQELNPRMERVIRYLENEMADEERTAFEQDIEADPVLRSNLEDARKTLFGLRTLSEKRLRAELKAEETSLSDHTGTKHMRWWWAAAALLVVTASLWMVFGGRSTTPQELAEEFALEEPGLPVLMNANTNPMDTIMNAYKLGQDTLAARLLNEALERKPGNDTLTYFAGILQTRLHNYPLAVGHFAAVGVGSRYGVRSMYHRSICLLRMGRVEEARVQLEAVIGAYDVSLAARARTLRDRLQSQ